MKILQIIYSLSSGGAERFVVDLSNELSHKNEIKLVTLRDDNNGENTFYKSEVSDRVEYQNLKIPCGYSFQSLFYLYKFIKNEKPDIVHFHISNIIIHFILPILLYRKCKYFQTQHIDVAISNTSKGFLFQIRKYLYKYNFVKTCAISKYNQKTLNQTLKINDAKLIVNGRNKAQCSEFFEQTKNEFLNYRKTNNTLIFLHVGRCDEQKNQRLLIEAFNIFCRNEDACLLIIGSGFNSKLGNELRNISCTNIHYLGERKNISDYFILSDAFCLSSIYEGMPITLIEAFSYGCIPISTSVSGSIDYIVDGVTGFLIKDFTIENYVEALLKFKKQKNQINPQKLIDVYNANFSIKNCAKNYLDWYKD